MRLRAQSVDHSFERCSLPPPIDRTFDRRSEELSIVLDSLPIPVAEFHPSYVQAPIAGVRPGT